MDVPRRTELELHLRRGVGQAAIPQESYGN